MKCTSSAARRGLTLIELVVVVAILAVLAGLVVPRLSFLQDSAGSATSAAAASQVAGTLETYKTAKGSYPAGLDTLLSSTTTTLFEGLWKHGATSYWPFYFETYTIPATSDTNNPYNSIPTSMGHSFELDASSQYVFYDHGAVTATSTPNTTGVLRTTGSANAGASMTSLRGHTFVAVRSTATNLIKAAGYPTGTLPANVKLFAFGVGGNSNLISYTTTVPNDGSQDASYYSRYIAIFKVYGDGKPASLATVVDSFAGGTIEGNIASYKSSANQ